MFGTKFIIQSIIDLNLFLSCEENIHIIYCRFLWILMILAALIIFLYYLSDRLIQYFKYEKVISVEESYVDQMEYPAITLCDQNTFKYVVLMETIQ